MKIQHPLLIRAVGATGAAVVRQLGQTLRYHFRYQDPAVAPEIARQTGQRYIYAFFHEVMLFPAYYWPWSEMHILISDHRDGELITQVVARLGFSVIRGSTTRGGTRALREMTTAGRPGPSVRHARRASRPSTIGPPGGRLPLQPDRLSHRRRGHGLPAPWRARSWDRFCVPRPFSPAACVVPPPVVVPQDADRETLEDCRREVERRMQSAMIEAEEWVEEL